ncbi:unnamed protein product [Didymodactylos carnosus]|uniref:TLDc domain-containing protein n=1 Tax=Didymodactylos carnosus TaxID=1234261 RepID=A0A8S2QN02_9BILA|nr:unnamed protein product [Didymodactylos carnosus]CAF4121509.1 unnamed protein product [Didymodactylos carnosus]
MATTVNPKRSNQCATCKLSNEKGHVVAICVGCSQTFCTLHYPQHRQMIEARFDRLLDQHARFHQDLIQTEDKDPFQLMQEIDEWQTEMIDAITTIATKAKQNLTKTLNKDKEEVKRKFEALTDTLRVQKSNSGYHENDVEQWKQQLIELEQQLQQQQTSNNIKSRIQLKLNRSIDFTKLIEIHAIPNAQSIPPTAHPPKQHLFLGGTLLNDKQYQVKLNEFYGKHDQQWVLIYKATRDGSASTAFHKACDGKGPTITIFQSEQGAYLFGGYTAIPWSSELAVKSDATAFLFTLTNPHNLPATNFLIDKQKQHEAITRSPETGPIFGRSSSSVSSLSLFASLSSSSLFASLSSSDFAVSASLSLRSSSSDFSDFAVSVSASALSLKGKVLVFIGFPRVYVDSSGYGCNTFVGLDRCLCKEIEVYGLH